MHDLDTSVLVPRLTAEPATPWMLTEFASAWPLKARVNSLPVADNETARCVFLGAFS